MNDWQNEHASRLRTQGLRRPVRLWPKPGPAGGRLHQWLYRSRNAARRRLRLGDQRHAASFRRRSAGARLPIVYTTIAYAQDLHDGGLFVEESALARASCNKARRWSRSTKESSRCRANESSRRNTPAPSSAPTSTSICARSASTRSSWPAARPAAASAPRRSIPCNTAITPSSCAKRSATARPDRTRPISSTSMRNTPMSSRLRMRSTISARSPAAWILRPRPQDDFDRWWPRAQRGVSAQWQTPQRPDSRRSSTTCWRRTRSGFDDLFRGGRRACGAPAAGRSPQAAAQAAASRRPSARPDPIARHAPAERALRQ